MANEMAKILVQNRARTAEVLAPGDDPVDQQRRDEGGQSDGEALKNDVERHREGELETRQQDGIEVREPWWLHDR